MDAMSPKDLDRLLTDTAFVRRLASALVRDPDQADDLAQDALVVALERPPRAGTSPRGWIATVMRRLAIDRAREAEARARREAAAARAESSDQAGETERRLELSRRVSDALRELEEPYRTALYLRYLEELPPEELARRLDVPVATAKTRLRRGLEMLRARFDREWNGRDAWSALLAPLASPTSETGLRTGVLLMSTLSKVVAVLCLCGAATWALWPTTQTAAPLVAPATASTGHGDPLEAGGTDRARLALAGAGGSAPDTDTRPIVPESDRPYARVLDERRFPVAGARVTLHVDGLDAGDEDDFAVTDADGIARFSHTRVDDVPRRAGLWATDDRGRAAAASCSLLRRPELASNDPRPLALGDLILRPGASLVVNVTDAGRRVATGWVSLECGPHRAPVTRRRVDATGQATFDGVPASSVVIWAESDDRAGRAERVLGPGGPEITFVALEPMRTIEVSVVDRATRAPIPSARVTLRESYTYVEDDVSRGPVRQSVGSYVTVPRSIAPTDARGRTRIDRVGPFPRLEIGAEADLYVGPTPPGHFPTVRTGESTVAVELSSLRKRRVTWKIESGEVAPPPTGTELVVRPQYARRPSSTSRPPLPTRVRVEDGTIVANDVCDHLYGMLATAPDGSIARLWVEDGEERGVPTSFRRPRRVDVTVRDTQGVPVSGVAVSVRDQGNSPLADDHVTDTAGRATFEGLWGRLADVYGDETRLGTVDLETGDGRVDGILPSRASVTLQFFVDGKPGLPSTYRVYPGWTISEDPASGRVRTRITIPSDGSASSLRVSAAEHLDTTVSVDPRVVDDEHPVAVVLQRPGSLVARVTPPREGKVRLRAEPWNATSRSWSTDTSGRVTNELRSPNAPDGVYRFDGLAPGRYRVREVASGAASESVEVSAGVAASEVVLDLSTIVRVRGRVSLPVGVSPWYSRVVVDDPHVAVHETKWFRGSENPDGQYVDGDGAFDILVPVAGSVTLRVAHPFLSPDPEQGSVVVHGPADDIVLKLVAGDEVRIPTGLMDGARKREFLRVYAYADEPVGEPARWFRALVEDGVARFTGLPRGTWTLWIDPADSWAPIVIRGVAVGEGVTTVEPRPSKGSALRVRVRHAAGTNAPRLYVSAMRDHEPMLLRSLNSSGEDTVVLTGLDEGRYDVNVSTIAGEVLREQRIEFDGVHDVEIDVDAIGGTRR